MRDNHSVTLKQGNLDKQLSFCRVLFCLLCFISSPSIADKIQVASASNFSETLKIIVQQFEKTSAHKVILISASTGKLYAQIKHGAPFDVFFSADVKRAELLDTENIAVKNTRFTYAVGKLILWSPKANYIENNAEKNGEILKKKKFNYLAMANPKLAPYGKAAREVLNKMGIWNDLQGRIVRGENISQTLQFVNSGNAQLGLVAYSQIYRPNHPLEGSFWKIPEILYTPIKQQAVLLKNNQAAHEFYDFVKSTTARTIIESFGYGLSSEPKNEQKELYDAQ